VLDEEAVTVGALALAGAEKDRLQHAAALRSGWAGDPWSEADGFALHPGREGAIRVSIEGETREIRLDASASGRIAGLAPGSRDFRLVSADDAMFVLSGGMQTEVRPVDPLDVDLGDHGGDAGGTVKSPMHGKLVALFVSEGEVVEKGQRVAIVEAMKMEHPVLAPRAGKVESIAFAPGAQMGQGARILSVSEEGAG
jgi:3-methylcrotonyl-CoA carboxylase alpha subunit